ncbi:hypothetical protein D5018_05395 [Parashewanella curva]|uniref:Uncharacterized protein n=1 Tax=Parashewanella curva TaxID=2338552 RepID=A0A3L8Q0X4_9GAMM|nr:hypothetical protein [Parashewanella curva]RLV60709.1 hypothetical protein D5018_05395 [Parashewanella curva]
MAINTSSHVHNLCPDIFHGYVHGEARPFVTTGHQGAFEVLFDQLATCTTEASTRDVVSELNRYLKGFHQGGPGFFIKTQHYGIAPNKDAGISCLVLFSESKNDPYKLLVRRFSISKPKDKQGYKPRPSNYSNTHLTKLYRN